MRVGIEEAACFLENSTPVAIPTETVWGLAARVNDEKGINRIYELKGRPLNNPLIIHINAFSQLFENLSSIPPNLSDLIEAFWPGSLTLVVPIIEEKILPIVRSGLKTAAFRMPKHPLTQALIDRTGPLVAPSANLSGAPSATTMQHIEADFGDSFPILSSEDSPKGIESTILIWSDPVWRIGRLGAIDIDALQDILHYSPLLHRPQEDRPLCPGQLYRHYAPSAKLTLSKGSWQPSLSDHYDAVLGFSDRTYPDAKIVVSLGSIMDPCAIAKNLYNALRSLDDRGLHHVFVDFEIPHASGYLAIIDRLTKASSK